MEALHHRHQRREAEANIRQELEANRTGLVAQAPIALAELGTLRKTLAVLEAASEGKQSPHDAVKITFHEEPIPDAAWRTASSTGVLAYMDYGEVENFAAAYKKQELLDAAEQAALEDYEQFLPLLSQNEKDISADKAREALPLVRRACGHVTGMLDIGQGTLETYNDVLK